MDATVHRRGMLVGALAALAMMLGLATAGEARAETIKSYCSPTGDYCIGVSNVRGRAKLEISTFSFSSYSVCLKGPGASSCVEDINMTPDSEGIYSSRIDVVRKFHPTGGRYKAAWFVGDSQIGKTLKFSLG